MMNKNSKFIGLNGNLAIFAHAQAIDVAYCLTREVKVMSKKCTDPVF